MKYQVKVFESPRFSSGHAPIAFEEFLNRHGSEGWNVRQVIPQGIGFMVIFEKVQQ